MTLSAPLTALTALLLVPIFIWLAFGVIKKRRAHRVAVGTGEHPDLEAAIRAHGNFAEYVPFALLLLLVGELNGAPVWLLGISAVALVLGRLIQSRAIPAGDLANRIRAMKLTFGALALGAVANLVALLRSVFVSRRISRRPVEGPCFSGVCGSTGSLRSADMFKPQLKDNAPPW